MKNQIRIETDGFLSKIYLDDKYISQFLTGYTISHPKPGDIPHLDLNLLAVESVKWEGPAIVKCSVTCPCCGRVVECIHDGAEPEVVETTGMDTPSRTYEMGTHIDH